MDIHQAASGSIELATYYELSWSILSSIGLFTALLSVWAVLITRPSPLSYIPIIISVAGAVANGLCYFSFYTSYPTPNRAAASAVADFLWLIQEAGLSFYSYQILAHTLHDLTRTLFLSIFWILMAAIASIRMAILASRVLEITTGAVFSHSTGPLQHRIDYLHVGYFATIALVETWSSFFLIRLLHRAYAVSPKLSFTRLVFRYLLSTTEMRVASLCFIGITRAVTSSLQVTSQMATTVAGQLDRFAYTMECLFPLVMVIDIIASKKFNLGDRNTMTTVETSPIARYRDIGSPEAESSPRHLESKILVFITGANHGTVVATAEGPIQDRKIPLLRSKCKAECAIEQLAPDSDIDTSLLTPLVLDANDDPSIAAAAKSVSNQFGNLDILINNAAICNDLDPNLSLTGYVLRDSLSIALARRLDMLTAMEGVMLEKEVSWLSLRRRVCRTNFTGGYGVKDAGQRALSIVRAATEENLKTPFGTTFAEDAGWSILAGSVWVGNGSTL
ncbi:hypothetical protein BBP40_001411 [Aspergillus hancockii]|nr:hypothetical protein BBP40_001411 [Aspergillus hancockii]